MTDKSRTTILFRFSKRWQEIIETEKNFWFPFGPIDPDQPDEIKEGAREYIHNLFRLQVKDNFDAYKQYYRIHSRRQAMQLALKKVHNTSYDWQVEPIYSNLMAMPFLLKRFSKRYGKLDHQTFSVLLGMYHAHVMAKIHWDGFSTISKTIVRSFAWYFEAVHWNRAVEYAHDRHWLYRVGDDSLAAHFLKQMSETTKHKVVDKILREKFYYLTADGINVFKALLADYEEHRQRQKLNAEFFRMKNIPRKARKEFQAAKKKLIKNSPRSQAEINKERATSIVKSYG